MTNETSKSINKLDHLLLFCCAVTTLSVVTYLYAFFNSSLVIIVALLILLLVLLPIFFLILTIKSKNKERYISIYGLNSYKNVSYYCKTILYGDLAIILTFVLCGFLIHITGNSSNGTYTNCQLDHIGTKGFISFIQYFYSLASCSLTPGNTFTLVYVDQPDFIPSFLNNLIGMKISATVWWAPFLYFVMFLSCLPFIVMLYRFIHSLNVAIKKTNI